NSTGLTNNSQLFLEHAGRYTLVAALFLLVYITAIDPGLDPNNAVRRVRLGESVVNVGAQGVQRQAPLQIPLRARNLIAVQPARHTNLDALAAKAQRRINRLAHRTAEANALLQLQRDVLGDQLRVKLRLVDLQNVNEDLARAPFLNVGLQLIDLRALAADNDAGTRGADDETQLVARALDFHRTDTSGLQLLAQLSLQLDVFHQQLVVAALYKPT